eukprot:51432-Pyramimonas_sp.AAC.1
MDIGQTRGHYNCANSKGTEEKTRPYDRRWLRSAPTLWPRDQSDAQRESDAQRAPEAVAHLGPLRAAGLVSVQ